MSYQLLRLNHFATPFTCFSDRQIKRQKLARIALALAVLCAAYACPAQRAAAVTTALDTYVAATDASYGFSQVGATFNGPGFDSYNIDLTSQTWRDLSEVDRNVWKHNMTIVEPNGTPSTTAILFINGGSNPGSFPNPFGSDFQLIAGAALATNSVFVNLPTVPNQSLTFSDDGISRSEDSIIAKTFKNFLDGGDDEWPLLLPMVKSAVAAMDATQDFMLNEQGVQIDKFFIFGGSKRGWTTWLTAATEARPGGPDRVSGIAPAVIDFLNVDESMQHHRNVYAAGPSPPTDCVTLGNPAGCSLVDGFSLAVADYVLEGVMQQLAPLPGETISARAQELLDIVDPYEYRDRIDIPKYIVNSTGDQFFAPDSSQFYYDDLIGKKYLRYIPNTDHGLDESAITGALTFKTALDLGLKLPKFVWDVSEDGTSITVNTSSADSLVEVLMWKAINPNNRDFREATFGANWIPTTLSEQVPNEYFASALVPATGATAYMVELTYDIGGQELKFTTEISVVGVSESVAVPEPASCALLVFGMIVSLLRGSRSKRISYANPN